jgi:hypothetical protein
MRGFKLCNRLQYNSTAKQNASQSDKKTPAPKTRRRTVAIDAGSQLNFANIIFDGFGRNRAHAPDQFFDRGLKDLFVFG